ncbi:MAG: pectate lyase [Pyrinomonadaceae bacterium]|nr:pectate lyase [Pyrinomonadaceae bacterium]
MPRIIVRPLGLILCVLFATPASTQQSANTVESGSVRWTDILKQQLAWYESAESVRIADNVLLYQRDSGGWPKNIDMAKLLTEREVATLIKQKQETDSTIDNGATYTQLTFLARVHRAKKLERHKEAFLKGIDYLLKAQYGNGGWPQYFPILDGYYAHITFNDGAMIGVMELLQDIAQQKPSYLFVDESRRNRAAQAVQKGITVILQTQVIVKGQRTVWGAQHDEVTLAPAPARTFEPVSLVSAESVGIVRFLMSLNQPNQQVIDAVQSAVKWFKRSSIPGIRLVSQPDKARPGSFNRFVVLDENAEPIWARFYEITTNRGIFAGRDGIIKYRVDEIEAERRNGYRWYVDDPAELLNKDYPAWLKQWPH